MRAEVETEKKETRTCSQQTSAAKEEAGNARAGNRSWSCAYMYIAKYTTLWSCSISFGCASKPMFIFNNGTSPVFDAYIGTLSRGVLNLGVVICIPRSGSFKLKSGALLTFASKNYWPEEGALAALVDLDCRILPVSLDANHQSASGRMWFLHVYILNYSVLIHIYIYMAVAFESRSPVGWFIQVTRACGKAQPTECRAGRKRSKTRRQNGCSLAEPQGLLGFLGTSLSRF